MTEIKVGDRVRVIKTGQLGTIDGTNHAQREHLIIYVVLDGRNKATCFFGNEIELVKEDKVSEPKKDAALDGPPAQPKGILLSVYDLMHNCGILRASIKIAEVEVVGRRDGKAIVLTVTEDEPF